jgi:hypothetical protein
MCLKDIDVCEEGLLPLFLCRHRQTNGYEDYYHRQKRVASWLYFHLILLSSDCLFREVRGQPIPEEKRS